MLQELKRFSVLNVQPL